MNMIDLPDGRFINPAHVKRVAIQYYFWSSDKWYLRIELRDGDNIDVGEKMTKDEAERLQHHYRSIIKKADVSPYDVGLEDGTNAGYEKGKHDGYEAGRSAGYGARYQAGESNALNQFLQNLHSRRNVMTKQQMQAQNLPPSERRRLNLQSELLTELIGQYSVG